MNSFRIVLPLVFCAALMPAHAADTVSMTYEAATSDVSPTRLPGACAVTIAKISDTRNNKESIGTEYRPIASGDALPWVSAALDNLKEYGFTVQRVDKAAPGGIVMNASLLRSYTYHGPMRINGMVAMDANFVLPSGEKINRKYRGSGSKTNMAGAVSEYMTTLNYSINNMLPKVAADLQQMCAGNLAAFKPAVAAAPAPAAVAAEEKK